MAKRKELNLNESDQPPIESLTESTDSLKSPIEEISEIDLKETEEVVDKDKSEQEDKAPEPAPSENKSETEPKAFYLEFVCDQIDFRENQGKTVEQLNFSSKLLNFQGSMNFTNDNEKTHNWFQKGKEYLVKVVEK